MYHLHEWCSQRPQEGIGFPETSSCEPLRVCWELRQSLLKEQQVFLTTEPPISPATLFDLCWQLHLKRFSLHSLSSTVFDAYSFTSKNGMLSSLLLVKVNELAIVLALCFLLHSKSSVFELCWIRSSFHGEPGDWQMKWHLPEDHVPGHLSLPQFSAPLVFKMKLNF